MRPQVGPTSPVPGATVSITSRPLGPTTSRLVSGTLLEKQERERRLHERESVRLQKKAKEKIVKMKAASKAAEKKADEKARKKFLRDAEER